MVDGGAKVQVTGYKSQVTKYNNYEFAVFAKVCRICKSLKNLQKFVIHLLITKGFENISE